LRQRVSVGLTERFISYTNDEAEAVMSAVTYFTVRGQRYELVGFEALSFGDARGLKRLLGGMSPQQAIDAAAELDPDAMATAMSRRDSRNVSRP
jgi:hypothetical protein